MKEYIKGIIAAFKHQSIRLEYHWAPKSRAHQTKPIFDALLPQLILRMDNYYNIIHEICKHTDRFLSVPMVKNVDDESVFWMNDYLPGLDIITIYAMMNYLNPAKVVEIGSGHSTAVMRKAIRESRLQAHITCIDPDPRRDISMLADHHVVQSLESLEDHSLFFNLSPGDIVFFDGSHLSLANTDVTVFFMEILPFIPVGVYVHIHDIYLPYDYPEMMAMKGYNEQYLLAQALMYQQDKFEIVFPAYWISRQIELQSLITTQFWNKMKSEDIKTHGGSFWFKIRS